MRKNNNKIFKEIISIHGIPRSGTSWLGQIFDSHPSVRYKFQPLFSDRFKDRINIRSTENEIYKYYNELFHTDDEFLDQVQNRKKNIYPIFKKKLKRPNYLVTKMVRYHYLIPHLLDKIENIFIVSIIRNPCACLSSWQKAPKEFKKEWDFNAEWEFAQSYNRFRPEEYYGFHRWKEFAKLCITMEKLHKNKFFLLQYEDLVKNPMKQIKSLFEFCNLDISEQTTDFIQDSISINNNETYSVYKYRKNTKEWQNQLDEMIINKVISDLSNTEFEVFLK